MNDLVFNILNRELVKVDRRLTVVCVGGYVLEQHGLRSTRDVDAFYHSDEQTDTLIAKVGSKLGLECDGELWLNNHVSSMNVAPPADECETLYSFSHLTVKAASLKYVLGMKLVSARAQDVKDAGLIIKRLHEQSPLQLFTRLREQGFDSIDISVVLESFHEAYGTEWLREFVETHQSELTGCC